VHIMMAYVGVEIELHSFFTSELDQDKQSASSQGHFTHVERTPSTSITGGQCGSQRLSTCFGEGRNVSSQPWIEPQFFDQPEHNLLSKMTELPTLQLYFTVQLDMWTISCAGKHYKELATTLKGFEPSGMWHCAISLVFRRNLVPSSSAMWQRG